MSLPDLFIETERLLIRPFTMADIEPAYQMNLDAETSRFTGDGGVVSREEMERRIVEDVLGDYHRYGFGRLAVEWKENNRFIGFTGLKYLEEMRAPLSTPLNDQTNPFRILTRDNLRDTALFLNYLAMAMLFRNALSRLVLSSVGLFRRLIEVPMNDVDLGYRFMSAYWGKGIATESGRACVDLGFGQLGLNKLIAMVLPENTGSIRVLDKLDFTFAHELMEDQQLVHVYSLVNP